MELAVVDAAGRLQIPANTWSSSTSAAAQVELTEQGILIRPPEKEHHTQDHVASSGDQASQEPEKWRLILVWRRLAES